MIIYDNIHGYIHIDELASQIIDTTIFQRLKNIHQTGLVYYVFPSAIHSRFEHSIGTYFLSLKMIKSLAQKHPELNISNSIIQLVSIAGLCHDLGHLLYSHLFDNCFLPLLPNYNELKNLTNNIHHENRSIFLLKYIINKYNIDLSEEQIQVIGDLINPKISNYDNWKEEYKVGEWIFQIVSNPINSIDVDKFDYLLRDIKATGFKFGFNYDRLIEDSKIINNNICYSTHCYEDIYYMFFIRYRLNKLVYNHKSVKAIEILAVKILLELEKIYNISNYILYPEKMILLVDSFLWNNVNQYIENIINDIHERKWPKLVYQKISLNDINFNIDNILKYFDKNTFEIIKYNIGYASSNPFNNIKLYKKNNIIINYDLSEFSLFINNNFNEYIFRIYCCDLKHREELINFFINNNI